ncbi:MAG: acyl carrier protein [Minicystis sp.]
MKNEIRAVLQDHARLAEPVEALTDDTDLYSVGMTSFASVNVLLALESRLGIEFPDHMLRRSVFQTIASIHAAAAELLAEAQVAP